MDDCQRKGLGDGQNGWRGQKVQTSSYGDVMYSIAIATMGDNTVLLVWELLINHHKKSFITRYSYPGGSAVKNLPAMQETQVQSLRWEDPLEKEMATHSSILAGKSHAERNLAGYSPWRCKESDTTEWLNNNDNKHLLPCGDFQLRLGDKFLIRCIRSLGVGDVNLHRTLPRDSMSFPHSPPLENDCHRGLWHPWKHLTAPAGLHILC